MDLFKLLEEKNIYEKLIKQTRELLEKILLARGKPIKNTSKKDVYEIAQKLQEKYQTNRGIDDETFLNELLKGDDK